ncbi:hypothetical protein GH714_007804 [Hevea brasiliensis]|uniref:Uncharacterized protein n=1 Tax=Hevea brasiliensis TaxID=3981 RepID=A0A6A6MYA1_HEVBR|nr:hypothetical protein GH714_007804 [Hevea brasiliensis]
MRGHLDDCMSFASCSSTRNAEEEDDEGDQLVRRRRRSDLEGDDLAESSAARRRHSRILSRWAARQAQEMITTIERRNRESELMALAGLHTNERGDNNGSSREQSPDLGEVERERVRQIVRGWMETGISDHTSNVSHRNSSPRGEWLGETERERVRIVREWVQMASQQRGGRGGRREEQAARLDAQVDRVRDGSAADNDEGQPEHIRRDMLRLRGRQALLDLLVRIERERQRELQGLLEHRAVSDFAHRNRIQSLLRGRFLRNERPVEEERPPSMAASELVQLRQRHTVSGLREGFRSRLENIVRGQVSGHSDSTLDSNVNDSRNDWSQTNTSQNIQLEDNEQLQPRSEESDINRLSDQADNLQSDTAANNMNWQETANQGEGWQGQITDDGTKLATVRL